MKNNEYFSHLKTDSCETIVNTLKKYGLTYIPDYLSGNEIKAINCEFNRLFKLSEDGFIKWQRDDCEGVRTQLKYINSQAFSLILSSFSSSFLKTICHSYLGFESYFNKIFVAEKHQYINESTKITDPHFDTIHSLKYLLYLNNITVMNGAFKYAPGTHNSNTEFIREYITRGGKIRKIPNVCLPSETHELISIEGRAGTLIIFDTNGFHGGSHCHKGYSRKIIRAHSYSFPKIEIYPALFSRQWWRESLFNPKRYFEPLPNIPSRPMTGGTTRVKRLGIWEDLSEDIFFPVKNALPQSLRRAIRVRIKRR